MEVVVVEAEVEVEEAMVVAEAAMEEVVVVEGGGGGGAHVRGERTHSSGRPPRPF